MSSQRCLAFLDLQSRAMPSSGDVPSIRHFFRQAQQEFKDEVVVVFAFVVTGERRLTAIVESDSWHNIDRFNKSIQKISKDIDFTVTPVIGYEKFAQFLGVDGSLTGPAPRKFSSDKHIFLLEFQLNYQGHTLEDLKTIWKEEATGIMTARQQGLEVEAFKVVNERRVICFVNNDSEQCDALAFGLPIMRHIGNQVMISCKPVIFLKSAEEQ